MPQLPDIEFNEHEISLMFSREIFPLKRQINQKIYTLFEQIKNRLKDTSIHRNFTFPASADTTTGKISQGENHNQFPWVMLDFPKLFSQNRIFAYRTLFWYGSGFSNSILIGGEFSEKFTDKLLKNKTLLHHKEIYFSFSKDPWDHEVAGKDSATIEQISAQQIISHTDEFNYFKLSNAYKLTGGEEVKEKSIQNYELFLQSLS